MLCGCDVFNEWRLIVKNELLGSSEFLVAIKSLNDDVASEVDEWITTLVAANLN